MKQEPICSIVQDLLPNYMEKLTSAETNAFIEEHLESCERCREAMQAMSVETGEKERFPKKELKFFKKIRNTRIIAAVLCILLALAGAYLLYAAEYEFSSDKGVLSTAITEYVAPGNHPVDAYVLETREADGVLIAFFKDNSDPRVYGFARLLKGINQKYRLVSANYGPAKYSAVVEPYEFTTRKGTYYAVGGYNCDDEIAAYGLNFVDETFYSSVPQKEDVLLTFDIKNPQFLDFHSEQEIISQLHEYNTDVQEWFLNRSGTVLLDSEGNDITENYRSGDRNWSSSVGTAELFVLYVFIAIVLILGIVFARYFLSEK